MSPKYSTTCQLQLYLVLVPPTTTTLKAFYVHIRTVNYIPGSNINLSKYIMPNHSNPCAPYYVKSLLPEQRQMINHFID